MTFYTTHTLPSSLCATCAELAAGQAVLRSRAGPKLAGVAVRDIRAPTGVVLAQILDVEGSVGKAPYLVSNKIYANCTHADGSVEIRSAYVLNYFSFFIRVSLVHTFVPQHRCLTWTIDTSRHSDLVQSIGYWRADPHPNGQQHTRLYYSADMLMQNVPKKLTKLLTPLTLSTSMAWAKEHAELAHRPARALLAPTAPTAPLAAALAALRKRPCSATSNVDHNVHDGMLRWRLQNSTSTRPRKPSLQEGGHWTTTRRSPPVSNKPRWWIGGGGAVLTTSSATATASTRRSSSAATTE